VPTVVLLLPTSTYRATDFVAAARSLGVDLVVGSDEAPALADPAASRALAVPLDDTDAAVAALVSLDDRRSLDAIVAVDDQGVLAAARAAERLGLPHNPPEAVARTRDKVAMRLALAAAEVPQPRFIAIDGPDAAGAAMSSLGGPVVVKPVGLSASRGVIRADGPADAVAAARRAAAIAGDPRLLVEELVTGAEVAVEGLLRAGQLEVLAVLDKPDARDGPYFEETIYVTPSRALTAAVRDALPRIVRDAATALGLTEGPIHAELRADGDRVWLLEVAARSIGGLCGRALRFGAGISLEELILRHALGMSLDGLERESAASGVMMLPIERSGTLVAVHGQDRARAVDGIVGLEITIPPGRPVVPLPEGDRYLGFLFARAPTPGEVEGALRAAQGELRVELA
jgi:biotin carboxylase